VQRLYKSRKDKVLDGVCGGLGNYFDVDSVVIRIIWILATFFTGGIYGIFAYLIAMAIIPREPGQGKSSSAYQTNDSNDVTKNEKEDTVERIGGEILSTGKEETKVETSGISDDISNDHQNYTEERKNTFSLLLGLLLIIFGSVLLLERLLGINLRAWFFEIQTYMWPLLLVGLGVFLLTRRNS
jgi:phage shock protein C